MKKQKVAALLLTVCMTLGGTMTAFASEVQNIETQPITTESMQEEQVEENTVKKEEIAEQSQMEEYGDGVRFILEKDETLPVDEIISALQDETIGDVYIASEEAFTIPKELISVVKETDKELNVGIWEEVDNYQRTHMSWRLDKKSAKDVEENLNLNFTWSSEYSDKIEKAIKEERLVFMTFEAQEPVTDDDIMGGPMGISLHGSRDKNAYGDFIYSYNPVDGYIREAGEIHKSSGGYDGDASDAPWYISGNFRLNQNETTIFFSSNPDLDGVKVEDDSTVEETPVYEIVLTEENTTVTSADLQALVEINKTKDVVIKTPSGVVFTFAKGSMKMVDGKEEYNFGAEVIYDYAKMGKIPFTAEEIVFRVNYDYEGELPGIATISIPVDEKWNGKTLYYHQLIDEKKAEFSQNAVVSNGTYTITQNHCSDYVASTKELKIEDDSTETTPKTSDTSSLFVLTSLMGLAGISILKGLKKN